VRNDTVCSGVKGSARVEHRSAKKKCEPLNENDEPTIEQILCDPAASYWLKSALRSALLRDPIDAANEAEVLAQLLDRRCRALLAKDPEPIP
jgi:hypothetical protein